MVLTNKIRGAIAEKGLSLKEMAQLLGMAPKTLRIKLNKGVFGTDEAEKMIEILGIEEPAKIFFASEVTYKDTEER